MCRCVLLHSFQSLESTGIKVDVRSFILWTNFESLSSLSNSNTYTVYIDYDPRGQRDGRKIPTCFSNGEIFFKRWTDFQKTTFIALYLFADPRRLLRMPPFHTHIHVSRKKRKYDGLVWFEQIRENRRENRSFVDFLHRYVKLGGKNIKGKRTILTAFHDIKSFFELLERRRSSAKREQHSRYSWKFENVSVTRLFCTSLFLHIHTHTHTHALLQMLQQ